MSESRMTTVDALEAIENAKGWNIAILNDAVLTRQDLPNVELPRCRAENADFSNSDMSGADLSRADLRKSHFMNTILKGAKLYEANLFKAKARKADFRLADMRNANLQGANLQKADFRGTQMSNTNMTKTDLTGALLDPYRILGADLTKAKGGILTIHGLAPLGGKVTLIPSAVLTRDEEKDKDVALPLWHLVFAADGLRTQFYNIDRSGKLMVGKHIVLNEDAVECLESLLPLVRMHILQNEQASLSVATNLLHTDSI